MNLIGGDDKIVLPRDACDLDELLAREDAPNRVVRIAQQQQSCARRDRRFETLEVPLPAAAVQTHRDRGHRATLVHRSGQEWVIDRHRGDDVGTFIADRAAYEIEGGDEPGQPQQPLRLDLPAICGLQMRDDRTVELSRRIGVTEYTVLDALYECFDDRGRRAENPCRLPTSESRRDRRTCPTSTTM